MFTVLCLACFHGYYTVNDDIGIIGFAADGYPIPYVGIVFSSLLHLAYVAAPAAPWFGLALYALQTLGLWLWLMLAWRVLRKPWLALLYSLVLLGYYFRLILSVDFTAVSIMLCMAAVAWASVQALEGRGKALDFVAPGLVFMLGMMVRPQGAPGALAYGLPVLLAVAVTCLGERPFMPALRRLSIALCLFLIPAVVNTGVDALWRDAVRTPQEAQYDDFNAAATEFSHLSPYAVRSILNDSKLLESVHWTQADVIRFTHWQFLDERVYTPEAMRALMAGAPPPSLTVAGVDEVVKMQLPPENPTFLGLIAVIPLFLYLLLKERFAAGIIGCLLPVYCAGLTTFMYLFHAFHGRLELPFETGLGLLGLLMAGSLTQRLMEGRRFLMAACLSLGIALVGAGSVAMGAVAEQRVVSNAAQGMQRSLRVLNTGFAGKVVLLRPDTWNLYLLSPLNPVELKFRPIELGWNTFSPRFYRQIGALGIQQGYQLVDALADRPDAFVMCGPSWCRELVGDDDGGGIGLAAAGPGVFRLVRQKPQSAGQAGR